MREAPKYHETTDDEELAQTEQILSRIPSFISRLPVSTKSLGVSAVLRMFPSCHLANEHCPKCQTDTIALIWRNHQVVIANDA